MVVFTAMIFKINYRAKEKSVKYFSVFLEMERITFLRKGGKCIIFNL